MVAQVLTRMDFEIHDRVRVRHPAWSAMGTRRRSQPELWRILAVIFSVIGQLSLRLRRARLPDLRLAAIFGAISHKAAN